MPWDDLSEEVAAEFGSLQQPEADREIQWEMYHRRLLDKDQKKRTLAAEFHVPLPERVKEYDQCRGHDCCNLIVRMVRKGQPQRYCSNNCHTRPIKVRYRETYVARGFGKRCVICHCPIPKGRSKFCCKDHAVKYNRRSTVGRRLRSPTGETDGYQEEDREAAGHHAAEDHARGADQGQ